MLGQRIVTAVVLLALLVPALAAQTAWPFLALTGVLIAAAGWEWARLNGLPMPASLLLGALLALACIGAWLSGWTQRAPDALWWLMSAVWVLGGALALRAGPSAWLHLPLSLRLPLGLLALWVAWLALAGARSIGLAFILSILCLVWVADIAAYAGGRTFGRRKLAPSISPGKSWEGAFSGLGGVFVLAGLWLWWEASSAGRGPSLYSDLWNNCGPWMGALLLVSLTAMSVVGDLMESLVKRAAGAKDSSKLLPGHGGVLDRVDALLPTLPMAMAIASWSAR